VLGVIGAPGADMGCSGPQCLRSLFLGDVSLPI
jgi:hypothetical protein